MIEVNCNAEHLQNKKMTFEIILIAALIIALSFWLEENASRFLPISNIVFIIMFACILANSGVIPAGPETYDDVFKWCVPLGIALMLMAFNPKQIFQIKKEFLICFGIGTIASVIGGIVAGILFATILPEDYWKVTGQLTASYIGGYENAITLGTALNIPTPLFVQVFAADSILTALWILFNIYQGKLFQKSNQQTLVNNETNKLLNGDTDVTSTSISIAIALLILFVASWLTSFFPEYSNAKIILVSLLATLITFTPIRNRFSGTYILGSVVLSFFFFACGAISDVVSLVQDLSLLILFPTIIVAIHGVILFGFTKWLKIQNDIASITSQALIGGPATALAVVMALKLPYRFEAIALGLLGYAIASYIGIATAMVVKVI
jgi:uncharacterized membrane protein